MQIVPLRPYATRFQPWVKWIPSSSWSGATPTADNITFAIEAVAGTVLLSGLKLRDYNGSFYPLKTTINETHPVVIQPGDPVYFGYRVTLELRPDRLTTVGSSAKAQLVAWTADSWYAVAEVYVVALPATELEVPAITNWDMFLVMSVTTDGGYPDAYRTLGWFSTPQIPEFSKFVLRDDEFGLTDLYISAAESSLPKNISQYYVVASVQFALPQLGNVSIRIGKPLYVNPGPSGGTLLAAVPTNPGNTVELSDQIHLAAGNWTAPLVGSGLQYNWAYQYLPLTYNDEALTLPKAHSTNNPLGGPEPFTLAAAFSTKSSDTTIAIPPLPSTSPAKLVFISVVRDPTGYTAYCCQTASFTVRALSITAVNDWVTQALSSPSPRASDVLAFVAATPRMTSTQADQATATAMQVLASSIGNLAEADRSAFVEATLPALASRVQSDTVSASTDTATVTFLLKALQVPASSSALLPTSTLTDAFQLGGLVMGRANKRSVAAQRLRFTPLALSAAQFVELKTMSDLYDMNDALVKQYIPQLQVTESRELVSFSGSSSGAEPCSRIFLVKDTRFALPDRNVSYVAKVSSSSTVVSQLPSIAAADARWFSQQCNIYRLLGGAVGPLRTVAFTTSAGTAVPVAVNKTDTPPLFSYNFPEIRHIYAECALVVSQNYSTEDALRDSATDFTGLTCSAYYSGARMTLSRRVTPTPTGTTTLTSSQTRTRSSTPTLTPTQTATRVLPTKKSNSVPWWVIFLAVILPLLLLAFIAALYFIFFHRVSRPVEPYTDAAYKTAALAAAATAYPDPTPTPTAPAPSPVDDAVVNVFAVGAVNRDSPYYGAAAGGARIPGAINRESPYYGPPPTPLPDDMVAVVDTAVVAAVPAIPPKAPAPILSDAELPSVYEDRVVIPAWQEMSDAESTGMKHKTSQSHYDAPNVNDDVDSVASFSAPSE